MRLISIVLLFLFVQPSFAQAKALDNFITSYAKVHRFSGTILISRNSKVSFARSFGLANLEHGVPNRIGTKYKIASITKAFTSVLTLQLAERGKLDLNASIKTYLPDYVDEAGDRITVHQLLNHTAGMANIDRNLTSVEAVIKTGMPNYQTPLTTDQLLSRCSIEKLVNAPGKVFDYNNADYIILGKIIERIYGKSYQQVLQEEIFNPLQMKDSGMLRHDLVLDGLASTYFYRDDLKRLANDFPVYIENWYAAGAAYSTGGDLLKFARGLFGRKLLKKETLDRMFTPGLDEYGYGVWVYDDYEINGKKYKIVKRPGRIMGANSMLFHIQEADATIIILSNTDAVGLDKFAAEIGKQLLK